MNAIALLSAETLGQISLIQSMVVHLPDQESMLGFVCRGLEIVPGAREIGYHPQQPETAEDNCPKAACESTKCFSLRFKKRVFGALHFSISDTDRFSPYIPYIENLCNMLAVILEERRQRRLNEAYQENLEQRVSERTRQLEKEIREHQRSQQLFNSLINNTRNVIYIKNLEGRYTLVNQRFHEIFDLNLEQVIGANPLDLFPEEVARQQLANDHAILLAKTPLTFEEFAETAEGRRDYISIKFPIFNGAGDIKAVGGISTDITELKQTENALRLDEARLEALLKLSQMTRAGVEDVTEFSLKEAIRLTGSRTGYLAFTNEGESTLTVHALSPLTGEDYQISIQSTQVEASETGLWGEAFRQRKSIVVNDGPATDDAGADYPKGRADVRRHLDIPVFEGERITAVAGVGDKAQPYDKADVRQLTLLMQGMWQLFQQIKDLDEKMLLEKRIRQAYKMEAIGTLAGGIAHDFNNILSALLGYTEISLMDAAPGTAQQTHLEKVLQAGKRARDLVSQILTFSRQSEQALMPVQVTPIVKEALKFIRASLSASIEIKTKLIDEPTIMADATQLHQVLMNLCTNAGHAMAENGGILDVRLEELVLDAEFTDQFPDLSPGHYMKLTVSDTGHGISPEVMDRIFDPFFTTKQKEEGTGMGLSVVHGIIKNHDGIINVYSEPGQGTVFNIFLPALEKMVVRNAISEKLLAGGTERILFIDDEEPLVDLGVNLLEGLGYTVTGMNSSVEALSLFEKNPDQFDLVITDMAMPKITGDRLAKEILRIKPDLPIILCTGFSASLDEEKALAMGIRAFINKPILRHQISEAVRGVLDN